MNCILSHFAMNITAFLTVAVLAALNLCLAAPTKENNVNILDLFNSMVVFKQAYEHNDAATLKSEVQPKGVADDTEDTTLTGNEENTTVKAATQSENNTDITAATAENIPTDSSAVPVGEGSGDEDVTVDSVASPTETAPTASSDVVQPQEKGEASTDSFSIAGQTTEIVNEGSGEERGSGEEGEATVEVAVPTQKISKETTVLPKSEEAGNITSTTPRTDLGKEIDVGTADGNGTIFVFGRQEEPSNIFVAIAKSVAHVLWGIGRAIKCFFKSIFSSSAC